MHAPARLGGLTIPAPLILGGGKSNASSSVLSVTIDGATGVFEIVSIGGRSDGQSGARTTTHLQGVAVNASVQPRVEPRFGAGRSFYDVVQASAAAANTEDAIAAAATAHARSRAAGYATMINGADDDANGMWQG